MSLINNNGFLLSGKHQASLGPREMVLIKLSSAMELNWVKKFNDVTDQLGRASVQD